MGFILDQSVFGQGAGVKEAAAGGVSADSVATQLAPTQPVAAGSGAAVVNEAFMNPAAQRERRERDLVRFVLSHSRAELEIACLALGAAIEGKTDEALREVLFRHHRGAPQPSRLPL
ncbi:MAG TPA: hypothetical protein PKA20_09495 [Burkholderiaceae bacterium]|nr:hypothetical protein [Burkholderiaceae bacterium]